MGAEGSGRRATLLLNDLQDRARMRLQRAKATRLERTASEMRDRYLTPHRRAGIANAARGWQTRRQKTNAIDSARKKLVTK